jgi:hypothetical protein
MAVGNKELDYDHHLAFYKGLGFLVGHDKQDAYWHRQAEYLHVLSVCDAILDAHFAAITLAQSVISAEAKQQLNFGVGRRSKFIWLSLRNLLGLIHPERTDPLPHDEVEEAARDLNVIYINIRGTLDDFTWCLLDLFGEERTREIALKAPATVNLFGGQFLKDANLKDVAGLLKTFHDWNSELKARRDPSAHRIPLSVPPAFLDENAHKEYVRILAEHDEVTGAAIKAARAGDNSDALFERAHFLHGMLERVGTFRPVFVHHTNDGVMKIYPVVPQDIGELVKIARGITAIIDDKLRVTKQVNV